MNATDAHRKIHENDARSKAVTEWLALLEQKRTPLLLRDDDSLAREVLSDIENGRHDDGISGGSRDEQLARGFAQGFSGRIQTREAITELEERRAALVAALPSDEEVAQAEREVAEITKELDASGVRRTALWAEYQASLEKTKSLAREFIEARNLELPQIDQLNALGKQFDLDVARGAPSFPDDAFLRNAS